MQTTTTGNATLSAESGVNWRLVAAALVFVGALATIGGAWGFELIGEYMPCKLCLQERIPYYVGLPVAFAGLVAAATGADRLARILLVVTAGIFLWSLYLGVRHAGIEWSWWTGPDDCGAVAGGESRDAGGLLGQLEDIHIARCTEASWRFPNTSWGLSFAGWNAVISAGLVVVALAGAAWRGKRA